MGRLEKREVAASLTAERVLDHFGIEYQRKGGELRFSICPECGSRSREDTVSINRKTGRWRCHAHECAGDILAMVADYAGVDIVRDFQRVLEIAADIAGRTW